jgi:hypothetical protein
LDGANPGAAAGPYLAGAAGLAGPEASSAGGASVIMAWIL